MLTFKQFLKEQNTKIPVLDNKKEVYMYAPFGIVDRCSERQSHYEEWLDIAWVEYQGTDYDQAMQHLQQFTQVPEQLKQFKTVKGEYTIAIIQQGGPVFIFEVDTNAYKGATYAQEDLYDF